jgi:hypothetical protein
VVKKAKEIFVETVEADGPKLVRRFSGAGDPRSFPLVALSLLRSDLCQPGRGHSSQPPPSSLRQGKRGENMTQASY